jgi:hypothetical protein
MNTGCGFLCWHSHNVVYRFFFFFFFFFLLPSFLRVSFFRLPGFFNFFLPPGILLIHVYSPHTARIFCRSRSANMFVPLFSRPGWQRASGEGEVLWSESRDLGECEGAVETWDAAGERESA